MGVDGGQPIHQSIMGMNLSQEGAQGKTKIRDFADGEIDAMRQ